MQTLFDTQQKETFVRDLVQHYDQYDFQNTHQLSNILPLQDLSSPSLSYLYVSLTSSDINSPYSDFASPSSVDSNETKESLSLAKQSKRISKQKSKTRKEKAGSKRGLWSSSEDAKLVSLVEEIGQKWTKISKMIPGKGRKQVRDRYMNALRPGINWGKWTGEEENQFETLYQKFGKKWCEIAAHMPGRTENQVKNKYFWKKSQQPKKKAATISKSKGKACTKNAKASLKVQWKQSEETETVSENLDDNFNLLDKILIFEADTEQISPIDTEINYSEEPQRPNILEDILKRDFLEDNSSSWSAGVAVQQQPGYSYQDIDSYFCF